MIIIVLTLGSNQWILEKNAMLSGALPLTVIEKNQKKLDELTADDYRKATVLSIGRILSKRMKI